MKYDILQVDLSSNLLAELPETLGDLRNLKVYILLFVPTVSSLPKTGKYFLKSIPLWYLLVFLPKRKVEGRQTWGSYKLVFLHTARKRFIIYLSFLLLFWTLVVDFDACTSYCHMRLSVWESCRYAVVALHCLLLQLVCLIIYF